MRIFTRTAWEATSVRATQAVPLGCCAIAVLATIVADAKQSPSPQAPSFEVASVRPNNSGGVSFGQVQVLPGGLISASNISLRNLIGFAYGIDGRFESVDGRFDLLDQHFDVTARTGAGLLRAPLGQVGPINRMMQALLAERFKLETRIGQRQATGYALVRARPDGTFGAGMQPAEPCSTDLQQGRERPCRIATVNNVLTAEGADMSAFASALSTNLKQPVLDKTGLVGTYDIKMTFDQASVMEAAGFRPIRPEGGPTFPSLFTALQEQLGLKLEPGRYPVRIVLVERIEPLSPN